jgi:hypothetical protein
MATASVGACTASSGSIVSACSVEGRVASCSAARRAYGRIWVATGQAVDFYRACGWQVTETLQRASAAPATVLTKLL